MDSGLGIKEEKVDESELKEEKVKVKKEVIDCLEVKKEQKNNEEIKQMFVGQNIKQEEMINCVKEKYFLRTEIMMP